MNGHDSQHDIDMNRSEFYANFPGKNWTQPFFLIIRWSPDAEYMAEDAAKSDYMRICYDGSARLFQG